MRRGVAQDAEPFCRIDPDPFDDITFMQIGPEIFQLAIDTAYNDRFRTYLGGISEEMMRLLIISNSDPLTIKDDIDRCGHSARLAKRELRLGDYCSVE